MARKVEATPPSAGDPPALEAVASLAPEVKATIAGRELVFREYAVFEGFEAAAIARDFIADLTAEAKSRRLGYARVRRLIGPHLDAVIRVAAMSADVDPSFVRGLNRGDADAFFAAWFTATAGFFMREVLEDLRQEQVERLMASKSIASSHASHVPASGASISSSGTPSVN